MTFEEDLTKRRVDVAAFAAGDPNRFAEWQQMHAQMHPNSFYISVKMVLNDVRRRFWLAEAIKPMPAAITEAAPKPVTRRAAIPGAAKPSVPVSEMQIPVPPVFAPIEPIENKPADPVRGRAVIRKPAAANPEATNTEATNTEATNLPETKPPTSAETATDALAAPTPRPQPVFRKPAPTISPEENTSAQEQIAQDNTNHETVFHTNPEPATDKAIAAPKPPRPRPVIKRPTANAAVKDEESNITEAKNLPTGTEAAAKLAEAPKEPAPGNPPRPRPVMRRPSVPAENNVNPMPEAEVSPGAEKPIGAEPTGEEATLPKSPRPRPIIKRPAKPE